MHAALRALMRNEAAVSTAISICHRATECLNDEFTLIWKQYFAGYEDNLDPQLPKVSTQLLGMAAEAIDRGRVGENVPEAPNFKYAEILRHRVFVQFVRRQEFCCEQSVPH